MKFKLRLRQLREEHGITQKKLGEKIGVTRNAISTYESGKREPEIEKIIKLSEIFDCSVDYLIGASDFKMKVDYICMFLEKCLMKG